MQGRPGAAYCAAAGIRAVIVMPADSPAMNRKECIIAGASLYLVNVRISGRREDHQRGRWIGFGWYDALDPEGALPY